MSVSDILEIISSAKYFVFIFLSFWITQSGHHPPEKASPGFLNLYSLSSLLLMGSINLIFSTEKFPEAPSLYARYALLKGFLR